VADRPGALSLFGHVVDRGRVKAGEMSADVVMVGGPNLTPVDTR
jgi:hypothetical protein